MDFDLLYSLIPIIGGLLYFNHLRALFLDDKPRKPELDLEADGNRKKLESLIMEKMETYAQFLLYSYENLNPRDATFDDQNISRQQREANSISEFVFDKWDKYMSLECLNTLLSKWEDRGLLVCSLGIFLQVGLLIGIFAILLFKIQLQNINNTFSYLFIGIIFLPYMIAFICFLVVNKQRNIFRKKISKISLDNFAD